MNAVAHVVGLGLFTSIGSTAAATWNALLSGVSGVRPIERFDPEGLPCRIAAAIDDDARQSCGSRSIDMACRVAREAMAMLDDGGIDWSHAALFVAAPGPMNDWRALLALQREPVRSPNDLHHVDELHGALGEALAEIVGTGTPAVMVNTACASSATAIEMAVEALRDGICEVAVVVGSDSSVYEESVAKFCLISALSTANADPASACRPFSASRDGFVMGEGAGCLILASDAAVGRHRMSPIAAIRGVGSATDGYHRTRSSPDGSSIIASMQRALDDGGIEAGEVRHVNAHGTSTPENDKMEALGLRALFGESVDGLLVTASKSMIGHTLTAAGVIEAAISALSLRHRLIPPTLNHEHPDASLGVTLVAGAPAPLDGSFVLSNSFGFGGQNVSILLESAAGAAMATERRSAESGASGIGAAP